MSSKHQHGRDSNLQPLDLESGAVTSRPGHLHKPSKKLIVACIDMRSKCQQWNRYLLSSHQSVSRQSGVMLAWENFTREIEIMQEKTSTVKSNAN